MRPGSCPPFPVVGPCRSCHEATDSSCRRGPSEVADFGLKQLERSQCVLEHACQRVGADLVDLKFCQDCVPLVDKLLEFLVAGVGEDSEVLKAIGEANVRVDLEFSTNQNENLPASELVPLVKANTFLERDFVEQRGGEDLHKRFCQLAVKDLKAILAGSKILEATALVPGFVKQCDGRVIRTCSSSLDVFL